MKKTIYLNICDFIVRVVFLETEQVIFQKEWIDFISKHWGRLVVKNNRKSIDYTITFADLDGGMKLFLQEKDGQYHKAIIKPKKNRVEIDYSAGLYLFNGVIRDAVADLVKDTGLLLHASGCVDKQGNLYIFTAVSGGGKSTTSKLLENMGWSHFSDDLIVIRKIGKVFRFYRPPFIEKEYGVLGGKFGGNKVSVLVVHKNEEKVRIEKMNNKVEILRVLIGGLRTLEARGVTKKELKLLSDLIDDQKFYNLYRNLSKNKLVRVFK